MNENVLPGGALDKAIALGPIEPLHCALLSHKKTPFASAEIRVPRPRETLPHIAETYVEPMDRTTALNKKGPSVPHRPKLGCRAREPVVTAPVVTAMNINPNSFNVVRCHSKPVATSTASYQEPAIWQEQNVMSEQFDDSCVR